MARSFLRNLLIACGVFLFITLVICMDWPFIRPLKEYVSFVVVTDFSFQPVLQRVPLLQNLTAWDLKSFIQALPGR